MVLDLPRLPPQVEGSHGTLQVYPSQTPSTSLTLTLDTCTAARCATASFPYTARQLSSTFMVNSTNV